MFFTIENLDVWYGDSQVIFGVSIDVPEGEIVGLVGPNGAGKSTILKAISGFADSLRGQISLNGEGITGYAPHVIASRGISHVPEGKGLFQALTVEENLQMGAYDKR